MTIISGGDTNTRGDGSEILSPTFTPASAGSGVICSRARNITPVSNFFIYASHGDQVLVRPGRGSFVDSTPGHFDFDLVDGCQYGFDGFFQIFAICNCSSGGRPDGFNCLRGKIV